MKLTLCTVILCSLSIMGCLSTPPHRSSSLSYNKSMNLKKYICVLLLPFEYNIDREVVIDEVTEAFSVELRK